MIRNNKHKDLACMYKLLIRVDNGLRTICSTISMYLRELGKGLVAEDEGTTAISYIQVSLLGPTELEGSINESFCSKQYQNSHVRFCYFETITPIICKQ